MYVLLQHFRNTLSIFYMKELYIFLIWNRADRLRSLNQYINFLIHPFSNFNKLVIQWSLFIRSENKKFTVTSLCQLSSDTVV